MISELYGLLLYFFNEVTLKYNSFIHLLSSATFWTALGVLVAIAGLAWSFIKDTLQREVDQVRKHIIDDGLQKIENDIGSAFASVNENYAVALELLVKSKNFLDLQQEKSEKWEQKIQEMQKGFVRTEPLIGAGIIRMELVLGKEIEKAYLQSQASLRGISGYFSFTVPNKLQYRMLVSKDDIEKEILQCREKLQEAVCSEKLLQLLDQLIRIVMKLRLRKFEQIEDLRKNTQICQLLEKIATL